MDFAPVDVTIFRRSSILPFVLRNVARTHKIGSTDLDTFLQIYSLISDHTKGVKANRIVALKIRAKQTVYTNITNLELAGFIERRKRLKTIATTIYITTSGFALLNFFQLALKRIERQKFGSRVELVGSAKGGRISRKSKK